MESEDLGSDAFLTEEEDSDFEVESYRNRRRSRPGTGRNRSRRPGDSSRRAGRKATSSRHRRSGDSTRARSRREQSSRSFRPKLVRSDDEAIKSAGSAIVGARVSVFWQDSEGHSRVRLCWVLLDCSLQLLAQSSSSCVGKEGPHPPG